MVFEPRDRHANSPRSLPAGFLRRMECRAVGRIYRGGLNIFGPRFIRQDTETMAKQSIGLKHRPKLMLIDDADRPAKWYFALKAAYLESKRTGAPMVHPMEGPVVLRWRS